MKDKTCPKYSEQRRYSFPHFFTVNFFFSDGHELKLKVIDL